MSTTQVPKEFVAHKVGKRSQSEQDRRDFRQVFEEDAP